ncbi:MAG: helicase-associated domain-containing protein [Actinomycetota bacterium]
MMDAMDSPEALPGATLTLPDFWERLNNNAVKPIARRWVGPSAQKMRKEEAVRALTQALESPARVAAVVDGLSALERAGLTLLARHGGRMSVAAFAPALLALGHKIATSHPHFPFGEYSYSSTHMYSALNDLETAGIVGGVYAPHPETVPERYYSDRRAFYLAAYSDSRLLRAVDTAGPTPLELASLEGQEHGSYRRPAEVSLRLLELAEALRRVSPFTVTARGRPGKPLLKKIGKALGWEISASRDENAATFTPMEFYYRLLVAMGLVERQGNLAGVSSRADVVLHGSYTTQSRWWAVAYTELVGWQECDVPGMWIYGEDLYDPNLLNGMRGALLVALSALPDPRGWYSVAGLSEALFTRLGGKFALVSAPPAYAPWGSTEAQKLEIERKRMDRVRESWAKNEQVWIAHALAGPLYHLGLVEVGSPESGNGLPDRFRLTEIGLAAFYYPQASEPAGTAGAAAEAGAPRWVVQPNFDIIAYLDRMTPAAIAFLARVAERKPSEGAVGIYRLTRESVYAALESGLTLPALLAQLEAGAQQPLPSTLQRALSDWAARRERISLHLSADVLEYQDRQARDEALSRQPGLGVAVGEQFILVAPDAPRKALSGAEVIDYLKPPVPCLLVEETGAIVVDSTRSDFLVRGELSNWADQQGQDRNRWRITAASVSRAVQGGWTAEKILLNLQQRSRGPLPPLLDVGIRAWARKRQTRPAAGLAKELILQFAAPAAAEAVAGSALFKPHLRARLGERTFLVTAASLKPLRALLEEFGLTPDGDLTLFSEANPPAP